MGINRVKEEKYNKYRRKRNQYLFLLLSPLVLVVSVFVFLYNTDYINQDLLMTIYIFIFIGIVVLYLYVQPRIHTFSMYVDFYTMIHDDLEPLKVARSLYSKEWIHSLHEKGYKTAQDHRTHILLYKMVKKLENVGRSNKTLVFILIAKNADFDFYSDEVDRATEAVYINNKDFQKINRQITLQFKKYETLNEEAIEAVESMILYNTPRQTVINMTIAYLDDTTSIYAPLPKGRYPNRYAFYAGNELKRITRIKE